MKQVSVTKAFGGFNIQYKHASTECGCDMVFTVYFPPQTTEKVVPVVYYLSGLSCTDQNVVMKAGAQRVASELGIALIFPDTSPRGCNIEGEDETYDLGTGAGFYLDATEGKWAKNYRMYSYITSELPALLKANTTSLNLDCASIMGHSMGGHGALVLGLRNPDKYHSISAFSPICNPCTCPWGKKAFSSYLGGEEACEAWKMYDAAEIMKTYSGPQKPILVDQGEQDNFLKDGQLQPDNLQEASTGASVDLTIRLQDGYDHSYHFVSTFMADHLHHHAHYLFATDEERAKIGRSSLHRYVRV